ncbi:UDP-Glycosyltransferase superfamily protein [Forsythia ovata]|uniref:UDP-Glycosyltransferase superfamily protein n=1 Tax=Forsythia ovata TaxID=205694 RepID=A0ABD1X1B8_9LAMI
MGRNSETTTDSDDDDSTSAASAPVHSIRDRFPFKRNPVNYNRNETNNNSMASISRSTSKTLPYSHKPSRSHHHKPLARKLVLFLFEGKSRLLCIILVISFFAIATMVLQSSIMSVFRQGVTSESMRWRWSVKEELKLGSSLKFVPRLRLHLNGSRLDWLRTQPRIGIRHPRIGLILGNMKKDPSSLILYTVMKNLKGLGYLLKIYAIEDGDARPIWEEIGGQVSILSPERYGYIDWSIFEGIIADSLEVKDAISSLMQEPFCSVPLIWIIQEDTLANRLPLYKSRGWDLLISNWTNAFHRANVVVFPDFSLPMLYSALDTGNFFVIPGSPIDVCTAESYSASHFKFQLREENGFDKDDKLVLDIGTRLGLPHGSLRHYGIDNDVNDLILMADIILYGSSQDEQGFPPLLTRAMSFGVPVVSPDYPVIKKYVVDGVHGIIFPKHDARALLNAFSILISDGKLSDDAQSVASSGKSLVNNVLAAECITGYANLMENIFNFPSDVLLPVHIPELEQASWECSLFKNEIELKSSNIENLYLKGSSGLISSIVNDLEEEITNLVLVKNISGDDIGDMEEDVPTVADWDILREIESSEEVERLETEEIEERMEKDIGEWDEIYRSARKAEKLKFEMNERDEGELERTGQPVCIYEIYNGAGGWPFLHHGSLYRGLSLLTRSQRMRSDDVDAVGRLPILNDTYYRDILCEIGGMFAIANGVDNIHKRPWIGFQSWRAAGRKVSLSKKAEQVLEQAIQEKTEGDVVYFWARMDMDGGLVESNDLLTFWSMCDIMNGGKCRTAFEDAFRLMYALPSNIEALPPMPEDGGGHWSALHSWVMPTPSFLEFVMFSR